MIQSDCCGIDSHEDFEKATNWVREPKIKNNKMTLKIPMTCCIVTDNFPKSKLTDANCPTAPTPTNSHISTVSDCNQCALRMRCYVLAMYEDYKTLPKMATLDCVLFGCLCVHLFCYVYMYVQFVCVHVLRFVRL